MFQATLILFASITVGLLAPQVGGAQSKTLKLGAKFEGEIAGRVSNFQVRWETGGTGNENCYSATIPIALKAAQQVTITATVTGKDRRVGIHFFDPAGKRLSPESTLIAPKSVVLNIDEVNATGKYSIVVFSDRVGPFTLRATSESMEEDREALEAELKSLRRRIEEIETKLKALDAKGKMK